MTFKITDTKLYVPVVTFKTEDNAKLLKLLSKGFKRPIYWNQYKVIPNKNYNVNEYVWERLNASIQGVKNYLFLLMIEKTKMLQKIVAENIFFQDWKLIIMTLKLMKEIFMINQLMTYFSNTAKSEKYQWGRVMIIQQVVY